MLNQRPKILLAAVLAACVLYPLGYLGARSADLLVRTPEAIDASGLPTRYSNRIIHGRGTFLPNLTTELIRLYFYPACRLESWYRNRPSFFFREMRAREERERQAGNP